MCVINNTIVEEYLWWIANLLDDNGKKDLFWRYTHDKTRLSLARYDVGFVMSVADQTISGDKLTDRQFELIKKLIIKYTVQLRAHGIIVPDESLLVSLQPLRVMDRSKKIWLDEENNIICAKFQYNIKMIEDFRGAATNNDGYIIWNGTTKIWECGFTESNINWIVTYGRLNEFEISENLVGLFNNIIEVEKSQYAITLTKNDDSIYYIDNAAVSLKEYIEPIGQDLMRLTDMSGICAYTISDVVIEDIKQLLSDTDLTINKFKKLCGAQILAIRPSEYSISDILVWADLVGRHPIVIYDQIFNKASDLYQTVAEHYHEDEIQIAKAPFILTPGIKVVYTNRMFENVPTRLLISTSSILSGRSKTSWISKFEKVVYYEHLKNNR